jgi:hypothetical protein
MKIISPYGLLIAAMLTLSACGGGGSGSGGSQNTTPINSSSTAPANSSSSVAAISSSSSVSSLALSSSSSSSKKGNVVTITGLVTDNTIPNATVTIYVGSQTFITTSDANGKYTIDITVDDANLNKPIKAVAKGSTIQPEVEFVSLLPSLKTLIEQAGSDATLNSIENFAVNITNVTTAEFALIELNKFSTATDADLEVAKKNIKEIEKLRLAALIKIVVDSPDYNLPNGVNSTLELVSNKTTSDAYAATLDASLIESTIKTILNDKTLTPPSPLLGSWVMDDASLQYPNKTIGVISFINNTDFMFVVIAKQPYEPDCSSGVEFGTYDWNQTTGSISFEATEDGNGDCGVARIDEPQNFTISITGNEFTLGDGVFKKVGGNYPLAGSWTLVDREGRLNIHTYISSTALVAYSSESWGYLSYSYNAATGDFTTHTITASNEDFVEDFVGVVTKPNESELSSYDSIKKSTEVWTALSQLEYQFPDVSSSNELVGSWDQGSLVFLDSSRYVQAHVADQNCPNSIEFGNYTWDTNTGVFQSTPIFDGNEGCGFSEPAFTNGDPFKLLVENNVLEIIASDGGIISKTPSISNSIVGTWVYTPNGSVNPVTITFTSDMKYLHTTYSQTQTEEYSGLEYGTYTYNTTTGAFSISISIDTNSSWGFSHTGPTTITVSGDKLNFISDPTGWQVPIELDRMK